MTPDERRMLNAARRVVREAEQNRRCNFNTSRGFSYRFCDRCGHRVRYDEWPDRVCPNIREPREIRERAK